MRTGTKSGGVWWDPYEKIFKMWYEAGWIHTIAYATSRDGLKWERPMLDVRPGSNQVLPLDLKPDSWTVVPEPSACALLGLGVFALATLRRGRISRPSRG